MKINSPIVILLLGSEEIEIGRSSKRFVRESVPSVHVGGMPLDCRLGEFAHRVSKRAVTRAMRPLSAWAGAPGTSGLRSAARA